MDLKLEALFVPVSDVDRAKAFYELLDFRVDLDYIASEDYRAAQLTPPGSKASIIIGKGITTAAPGSLQNTILAVSDILASRADLVEKGVDVSEVFHYADGFILNVDHQYRLAGLHPDRADYLSFASFNDPDGNSWLLQELNTRLAGR
uniref:VOC family protein n=1 Tax=Arthrobacter sp. ZGTC131 TaxID=2058898 RepID=UPI000CE41D57|nr:VOC family protein [Arthrobacter sp. ZGTC131]